MEKGQDTEHSLRPGVEVKCHDFEGSPESLAPVGISTPGHIYSGSNYYTSVLNEPHTFAGSLAALLGFEN